MTQASLDQDLDELQVDYVDLMLVHYPATGAPTGGRQGL